MRPLPACVERMILMSPMSAVHTVEALRATNLNALVALLALVETRSVSEAARRAGISQSAMSHALKGLREQLDDPILVRGAGGLVLTARAEALAPLLASALGELAQALEAPAAWSPATAQRRFSIGTGDYAALLVLPPLLEQLGREAPGIALDVHSTDGHTTLASIEERRIDLAIVRLGASGSALPSRKLIGESFACLVRRGHPGVGKKLTLARFVALPHLLISPSGAGPGIVDQALAERGLSRTIALRVPSFLLAPLVVERSDLVVTAPRRIAERFAATHALELHPTPLPIPSFELHLVWHPRLDADPAHAWLRAQVLAAARA